MRRLWPALVLLAACGPPEASAPPFNFDFVLSAAFADTVDKLQVTLVTRGRSLAGGDCITVQQSCLVDRPEMTADRHVRVKDAAGVERRALVFPLNLKPVGSNSAQDVSVQGVPLGKDYALVIEAITRGAPTLAGSSCTYLPEVSAGTNPRVLAIAIKPLTPPVGCDPRVDR